MVVFSANGLTLTLPNPQLQDREIIDLRFVYKRMMSGKIRSYKLGPPITTLQLDFRHVNRPKVVEVITFLRASAGVLMSYKDDRDVIWVGKILNFPFEATHAAIRDNAFTLTFETA